MDLKKKINLWKNPEIDEHFDLHLVIKWLTQIAEALNYLHTRVPKIIHRDIKPQYKYIKRIIHLEI